MYVKMLVQVKSSVESERMWHYLHLDFGILALCNWYRSPSAPSSHMEEFAEELAEIQNEALGILVMGDLNIHHARWLRYSNANTGEGQHLKEICDDHSLRQMVKEPTRGDYTLDLALSDIEDLKVQLLPQIADHRGLLSIVSVPQPTFHCVQREVWHFKGAAWQNIKCELNRIDWGYLQEGTVNQATESFLDTLYSLCCTYIPHTQLEEKKQSHPWLDDNCRAAISAKNAAENTLAFEEARQTCATTLNDSHHKYLQDLKAKIATLSKSDKQWWRLNR